LLPECELPLFVLADEPPPGLAPRVFFRPIVFLAVNGFKREYQLICLGSPQVFPSNLEAISLCRQARPPLVRRSFSLISFRSGGFLQQWRASTRFLFRVVLTSSVFFPAHLSGCPWLTAIAEDRPLDPPPYAFRFFLKRPSYPTFDAPGPSAPCSFNRNNQLGFNRKFGPASSRQGVNFVDA